MTSQPPPPGPVLAVVGPTASGKSDLAVALALALDGEVVNADAMQLYRGMDLGTAKLPLPQRRGVPHHLLDVLEVTQDANVAVYQRQARQALDGIVGRGRHPVLVGGSGLYVRAALDLLDIPPTDQAVRAALTAELAAAGAPALHARLARTDPAAADRILASNGRRVVRALEVIELTGRPFSADLPAPRYVRATRQLAIDVPRPELDARVEARVAAMWDSGLVEEVRVLEAAGLRLGRTAPRALGYAQVLRLLAGELTEAAARQETVQATRRFVRRQQSWFRRDPRIHWLRHDADPLAAALDLIAAPAGGPRT